MRHASFEVDDLTLVDGFTLQIFDNGLTAWWLQQMFFSCPFSTFPNSNLGIQLALLALGIQVEFHDMWTTRCLPHCTVAGLLGTYASVVIFWDHFYVLFDFSPFTAAYALFDFQEAEVPWHLIAIAIFFTLIKLPGPYYPYWGRIIIPHFVNGVLLRTIWFAIMWYRRPQKVLKISDSIGDS